METSDHTPVEKKKTITLKQVCAWIIGGILILAGIGYLGKSIFSAVIMLLCGAIVLPPTYNLMSQKLHINFSGWLRAIVVVILLVISANIGTTDRPTSDTPKATEAGTSDTATTAPVAKAKEEPKIEPVMEVTATALVAEFKENGVAAGQKYGNKRIRVTGVVHSIDKDILGTPYVALAGDQYGINNVQCMFPADHVSDLVSLKKDTRATVEGVFSSNLINVLLNECAVVIK